MMDFGVIRAQNIKANTELLKSLGFETPIIPPAPKKNASPKSKKRKSVQIDKQSVERPKKSIKVTLEQSVDTSSRRRSLRIAAAKPILSDSAYTRVNPEPDSGEDDGSEFENHEKPTKYRPRIVVKTSTTEHVGNRLGKRTHDPKTFGAIPGIEVGTWWETRAECSTDAIHAPFVAGIAGSSTEGAYSVALSGGYEDDVDLGYAFTYTGSGGRDLKGTKEKPKNLRTAPQSNHQSFDNPMNAALKTSVKTKRPVRVVRGYKLNSEFAPKQGYRYDGLYTVEKAWLERGLNPKGYKVCKFAFKRLPGQPPLFRRLDDSESSEEENQDIDSQHDKEEDEGSEEGKEQSHSDLKTDFVVPMNDDKGLKTPTTETGISSEGSIGPSASEN